MKLTPEQQQQVIAIAIAAGEAIEEVRETAFSVEEKADDTPVTTADFRAHEVIQQRLAVELPQWPLLSEEGGNPVQAHEQQWSAYWLVDPLDGTKEFIANNGEYTVNLAFVVQGEAQWGVVYAPALGVLYWGGEQYGAWRATVTQHTHIGEAEPLQVRSPGTPLVLLGSRRHGGMAQEQLLAALEKRWQQVEQHKVGSSLKLCRVAEGEADIYPRFGPTAEWDTAAGQAVLEGAGGRVWTRQGTPLRYQRPHHINPDFYALGGKAAHWQWLADL